jgi:hypothetical protein
MHFFNESSYFISLFPFHPIFLNALHQKNIIIKKIYTLKCETRSNTFLKRKKKKIIYSMLLDFCTLACFTKKIFFFFSYIFFALSKLVFDFMFTFSEDLNSEVLYQGIKYEKNDVVGVKCLKKEFQLATIKIFLIRLFCDYVKIFFLLCLVCVMNEQLMTMIELRLYGEKYSKKFIIP